MNPIVEELADHVIGEVLLSVGIDKLPDARDKVLVSRVACAIQSVIDDEKSLIAYELTHPEPERTYADCVDSGMAGDSLTLERDR